MPLPFILGAAAVAAVGYGAKKCYDGYQDKELAENINNEAKRDYNQAKSVCDEQNQQTTDSLEKLGKLQLQIGSDFSEFHHIADKLLVKLNQSKHSENLKVAVSQHNYNATMAAIGGGSIAAGGLGMAGGAAILGGVLAAPILAIASYAYASHAEEVLEHAHKQRKQVDSAIKKMTLKNAQFEKTRHYVEKIYQGTNNIYTVFTKYFYDLKSMNQFLEDGGDINSIEENIIQKIENGYAVAEILTDIITTPLFKLKTDNQGNVILDENQSVVFETDVDGFPILNEDAINEVLKKADDKIEPLAE